MKGAKIKNKLLKIIYILIITSIIVISISKICFALGEPTIVSKLQNSFEKIESWVLKLATPAAAIAVATGIFIQKFSFGDEERIRTGKKIIRTSLFSYAFLLAIDLILSAIKSLIS